MTAHGHRHAAPVRAGVAILTVSDTRTEQSDRSGAAMRRLLEAAGHEVRGYRIVPDEPARVRKSIAGWLEDPAIDAILVSGGTGISARDRTFEAVADLLDKRLDGFGELFRKLSYDEIGSAAMLSRAIGGVVGTRLLFSLPGSTPAVELALEKLILPELGHLLGELRKHEA